eukprot:1160174-Pelagomonas_calceolata.AAC.7
MWMLGFSSVNMLLNNCAEDRQATFNTLALHSQKYLDRQVVVNIQDVKAVELSNEKTTGVRSEPPGLCISFFL